MTFQKKTPRAELDKSNTNTSRPEPQERRRQRIPMDMPRMRMNYKERPGYHRHVFNDDGGRIQDALEGGYQFVMKEAAPNIGEGHDVSQRQGVGSKVCWPVGSRDNGEAIMGYLMEIPLEYYEEDQRAREQRTLEALSSARRKGQSKEEPGPDELYPTAGGIKAGPNL